MKKLIVMVLILSVMLLTGTAWAVKGTVGLGVGMVPDYEGSDDTTGVPMFMFSHRYDSGRFVTLMGTNMKVNLLANKEFSLGPVLNYRMGRDDVDNKRVDAMKDLDDTLEGGVFAGLNLNNWLLGAEVLFDVSDEHDGKIAQGTLAYRWKATQDLTITPGVSVTWTDGSYMDHYFGVSAGNVGTSGLPLYSASSGIKDIGLNVITNYTPWENWGVMGILSYKSLLNDAKDSPVVDIEGDDKQMMIGVMATYRWGQ